MVDDDKRLVSGYNEASLQIQRLNYAWIRCANYSTGGDFRSWRFELDVIWRELSYDVFRRDGSKDLAGFVESETVLAFEDLDKKIDLAERLGSRAALYVLLSRKEQFLRILQNEANKGGHYVDADEDSMD